MGWGRAEGFYTGQDGGGDRGKLSGGWCWLGGEEKVSVRLEETCSLAQMAQLLRRLAKCARYLYEPCEDP